MSASPINSSAPLGAMEASAEELMNRARGFLQPSQALDVTHVFIAALPGGDDSSSPPTQISSTILSVIPQPEIVRALLSVEIKLHSVPATTPGAITDALRRAATIWLQHSAERKARVTDTVVIWGILSDDNAVTHLLRELKLDRAALLDALSRNFQFLVPDADVRDVRQSAHRVAPPSVSAELVPSYLLAAELVRLVQPSLDHHLADMHAVLMSNILNVLGSCTRPEIAVLTGHNGTPLYSIPQALADRFASDEIFTDQRLRLARYKAVHILNLETVYQLGNVPDEPEPENVLEMAMLQAVEDRAVLVLERMEILFEEGEYQEHMLGQLADPGDALVLGILELAELGGTISVSSFGLHSARMIASRQYSASQTLDLLNHFYMPDWATHGFVFADDAFQAVIALEPGAWIELRRKTLPYLVVGLARDTMQSIKGGPSLVRDTAQMALDALDELRQEWATTEETLRDLFWPVLERARTDIQGLLDRPIQMQEDKYLITGAHITAQLICPNDSEFHFPGHVPKEIRNFRFNDLPLYR